MVGNRPRVPFAKIPSPGQLGAIIEKCTELNPADRFPNISALRSALVSSLSTPPPLTSTPQINNWVDLITNNAQGAEFSTWDEIVRYIELHFEADETKILLRAVDIPQIEVLFNRSEILFNRLSLLLCKWITDGSFDFAYCDVLGARLMRMYQLGYIAVKAAATMAAFNMAYSHNRWLVMSYFMTMAGKNIEEDLADRLAMEMYAEGNAGLVKMSGVERAINTSRQNLHPKIKNAFDVVEDLARRVPAP